jgi:AcrR family transcriptional regulator
MISRQPWALIMETASIETPKSRGRPRAFDLDVALDKAMHLFAEQGYEGTSLGQLTEAIGVPAPSLYAAFGNKDELFKASIEHYRKGCGAPIAAAFKNAVTARHAVEALLMQSVETFHEPGGVRGCMVAMAALGISSAHRDLRDHACSLRQATDTMILDRIKQGQSDGDVPPSADAAAMMNFYTTFQMGLSTKAHDGQSKADMQKSVQAAMRLWESF